MINASTTKVYVRVDLASNRVVSVSDEVLASSTGKPVFVIAANSPKLEYYIVEKNPSATFGINVRIANDAERVEIDAKATAAIADSVKRIKNNKALVIRDFYVNMIVARFVTASFLSDDEITSAATYVGTDPHMVDVIKPLAIKIDSAYNEWRFNVCQPVIDAMFADTTGVGIELDEAYRNATQNALDAFLTARGFDIATYHR